MFGVRTVIAWAATISAPAKRHPELPQRSCKPTATLVLVPSRATWVYGVLGRAASTAAQLKINSCGWRLCHCAAAELCMPAGNTPDCICLYAAAYLEVLGKTKASHI